jgi:hypothetical protein
MLRKMYAVKPKGKTLLKDQGIEGRVMLKLIVIMWSVRV